MATPVFVSFDWDNDRHYKFLLGAWHNHPRFRFTFQDETPGEIDTNNVGRIKAGLTTKINDATHVLVIVGKHANEPHRKRHLIGHRNWINFEIHQAKQLRKTIVAVKIDRTYESPEELMNAGACWAMSFTEEAIVKALAEA